MFIPAYGNGGYRAFQLNDDGLPLSRAAQFIMSRKSIYGRRANPEPSAREAKFPGAISIFDNSTQRLIALDRFNNRILIYKAGLDVTEKFPAATVIIGQADFSSTIHGIGPNRMGLVMGAALDEENQRLFVADLPNNRVLVFDIQPDRLKNDPEAYVVIGQDDFMDRTPGVGPAKLSRPMSVAYDPVNKRLFVSDTGNHRVLIFDADPKNPAGLKKAIAVMGQVDFQSREPRKSLDQLHPETLSYDWRYHRLFIAEDLNHRIMVFDAHPDRVGGPATAIAVIGQPDTQSTHPAVSHNRLAMPRLTVDPINQKLYVSEGFPAGNRISIWNISPEKLATGMSAEDVIGHETPEGEPDFQSRMPQGHIDGQSLAAPRDVVLDPVDHRLFVGDEYNHRVVVWQLDKLNRIVDYDAKWVLGQPDLKSSYMGSPNAKNLTVPIALAYDTSTKRLFVGDGYHNRVMVYDATPDRFESGMAASIVIGQEDFTSTEQAAGKTGINFGVRMGRGIASNFLPMGLAVDEKGQRLFISDGENNRIVIHDIRKGVLKNRAESIGVLGQEDFDHTLPRQDALGLHDPGHLVFDPQYQRLFVIDSKRNRVLAFNVDLKTFKNGGTAIAVLGKPDFTTPVPARGGMGMPIAMGRKPPTVNGQTLVSPNGIAHDSVRQLLYVSDGGGTFDVPADRVLVFDVDPEKLQNGAAAFAAVGALNTETPAPSYFGGSGNYPGQFTVRDTRGIALDPVNGRLFTTGSFESRIVAFHFPRATWEYQVDPGDVESYGTLDAIDLGFRWDPRTISTIRFASSKGRAGVQVLYSNSKTFVDDRSERHSRILISEAAVPSLPSSKVATVFIETDKLRRHKIYLYNNNKRKQGDVEFVLRDEQGNIKGSQDYKISAGQQLSVTIEELGWKLDGIATVTMKSDTAVAITALRETENSRGETILAPAPMTQAFSSLQSIIVPLFINGGNKRSSLVLINPSDEAMLGSVTFYDSSGRRTNLGTASDFMGYFIPPHSVRVVASDGAGPSPVNGYALIQPKEKQQSPPHATALIQARYGDVWASETMVTGTYKKEARFAIYQQPTLIRHGEIDTQFSIVNPNTKVATVNVLMKDNIIFKKTINPAQQIVVSMKDDAGMMYGRGLVTLNSDQPVVMTAHQKTLNLRGELIDTELPELASSASIPYVVNGGGLSTEIRIGNLSTREAIGEMEFNLPDGGPAKQTILR